MRAGFLLGLGALGLLLLEVGCVVLALWLFPDAKQRLPGDDGGEA